MRELGVKKTGHFMLKVGIYLTVILGMIVQLISPALALAAENPTQAVTGTLTIKNQDEQGSPLNGAKYEIQNESHQVVANSEISKDGQATVPNLPVGNYTVTEKQSVSG
ncbi:prealbumin-like fold domain-containing protein, partial [Lacticaseibacillus paracasei]